MSEILWKRIESRDGYDVDTNAQAQVAIGRGVERMVELLEMLLLKDMGEYTASDMRTLLGVMERTEKLMTPPASNNFDTPPPRDTFEEQVAAIPPIRQNPNGGITVPTEEPEYEMVPPFGRLRPIKKGGRGK